MHTLPLFYFPTTWLWVDDDAILMATLIDTFSETQKILPFSSANHCLEFLQKYESPLANYPFLSNKTKSEDFDLAHCSPAQLDIRNILGLRYYANRYNEISVMITDYQMPDIDGLMLAEKTQLS